ncbi:hypothetical protein [Sphingomonas sp.]|uniref:hypothetical protein n=1 Tax=Sphingomonas sp. TaxID=28214 RepID=UPI00182FB8E5|nr:hypothetical protein [Sphingomonas sp.]MBA3512478.1 hypothetical protein [Sphingomonas sp.]
MSWKSDGIRQGTEAPVTLSYLESRVREEADAAATATSLEATLIHLRLATAYAKRFDDCAGRSSNSNVRSWVEDHRVW